jgi:DNA-binding transcriptional MerR regulator
VAEGNAIRLGGRIQDVRGAARVACLGPHWGGGGGHIALTMMAVARKSLDQIVDMRRQGYTLRAIGHALGLSHEHIRQILKGCPELEVPLVEVSAARALGCRPHQLIRLRKKGILKPRRLGRFWHYDKEELERARSALERSCPHCGMSLPLDHRPKYCADCQKAYSRNPYAFLGEQARKKHAQSVREWKRRHPERWRELRRRASQNHAEKRRREHYATTQYLVVRGNTLPVGTVFQATGYRRGQLVLDNGLTVPSGSVRKLRGPESITVPSQWLGESSQAPTSDSPSGTWEEGSHQRNGPKGQT